MAERKELHMLRVGARVWSNKFLNSFKMNGESVGFLSPPAPAGFCLVKKELTRRNSMCERPWGMETLGLGLCLWSWAYVLP